MKSLTKALLATTGCTLAAFALAAAANAQETLVFATTNPEQHPLNTGFLIQWEETINAEAN